MVTSQTAKVGVAVVNYKMPQLHIKAEVYCRRLIEFGAAMRHATAQLMHGGRRKRVCAAHLRLTQLLRRDQSTRPARPIAAGLLAARIKLR